MTYILFLVTILLANLSPWPAYANVLQEYDKVIWIDQEKQVGAAYERGKKLSAFPILTGDDETPTPPGVYAVKLKDRTYYSRQYETPMPYSLFFDLKGMRAIHEGAVPDPDEKDEKGDWATHGCIHVEAPYMKWLYDWTVPGKTVVVIHGGRVWEDEENWEGEDREAGKLSEKSEE